MGNSASDPAMQTSSSHGLASSSNGIEALIEAELPAELHASAKGLLRAVSSRVAVPGHFDAFCCQAFSKPEWAAASSPLIAEMFEEDEDQLAELARIPDLIIEMGSGQVNVTCMVASRWAARGETHRLSRLADAIVASHASKNPCSVDIMLALAATLAVTRFSRAEQLYNAALPLAGEDHQEALMDARRWLAAGRIVCSAAQDERDFWDVRLRKPKTAWSWSSKEEQEALDHLTECLTTEMEGAELFKAVLPANWWSLAIKYAHQQEKLAVMNKKLEAVRADAGMPQKAVAEPAPASDRTVRYIPHHFKTSLLARFGLGWLCGGVMMLLTVLVLAMLSPELVGGVLGTFRRGVDPVAGFTPAEMEAWRKEELKKKAAEMAQYEAQRARAKTGDWKENEQVLSGKSAELPYDSTQYMNFLVWLHLDPPENDEVRRRVYKLLLDRVNGKAIPLWEVLVESGAPHTAEIREAAGKALTDTGHQWSDEEKKRLQALAGSASAKGSLSTTNASH